MSEESKILSEALARIKGKYARRGQSDLWDDATRAEFIKVFLLVPIRLLSEIVDEILLNPPTDDRGRAINWLPDPSDVVMVARRMSSEGAPTPSEIVTEIMDKIAQFGTHGVVDTERPSLRYAGAPSLSVSAEMVVRAMDVWDALCRTGSPGGVINGLLLKHATNVMEAESNRLLVAGRSGSSQIVGMEAQQLPAGMKRISQIMNDSSEEKN